MELYKKQIVKTEKYLKYRDLLGAMLEDDVKYDLDEVDERIAEYLGEGKGE